MTDYIDSVTKKLKAAGLSEDDAVGVLTTDTNAPGFDLNAHVKLLRSYGISEDETVALLAGDTPESQAGVPTARTMTQTMARFGGPMIGGGVASGLAARSAPLIQAGAEALGTFVGDVAGRVVAGCP